MTCHLTEMNSTGNSGSRQACMPAAALTRKYLPPDPNWKSGNAHDELLLSVLQGVTGYLVQCGLAAAAAHQLGHLPCQSAGEGDGLRSSAPFSGEFASTARALQVAVNAAKDTFAEVLQ